MILTIAELQKNDVLNKSLELIKQSTSITFLTHFKPDADGISACAALSYWLAKQGKQVETIYPSAAESALYAQPENVFINQHHQTPDLLIACDTANYDRLYFPEFFKTIPLINIDHHISNSIKGTYNLVASDASSTCELVYVLFQNWNSTAINKEIASILLFGILYDSQSFQTNNTTPHTLRVAADLVEKKAELFSLNRLLSAQKTKNNMKLWGYLLQQMEYSKTEQSVWLSVNEKTCADHGCDMSAIQGLHNFIIQNMPVDIVALFSEMNTEETKISLRSTKTDVNALAQKFGGGGHKNAAGLILKKPLDACIALITPYFT